MKVAVVGATGLVGGEILKVLEERKLELAFEGQRWFDLKRTGKAVEIIKNRKKPIINYIARNIN